MNPRGADARTSPRIPIRLSAEVQHDGRVFTAATRDLSRSGLCLEADQPLPEGDVVRVGVFLVIDDVEDASSAPLELRGRVAWATPADEGQPAKMGIRFEALSPAQTAGLTRILKMVPATSAA